jgi:integrase
LLQKTATKYPLLEKLVAGSRRRRSGSHLSPRGEIYYYRRAVPKDARRAFGCTEVIRSLETANETEAKRLEKQHDVDFERRLREAREACDPHAIAERIVNSVRLEIGSVNPARRAARALADAPLTDEGRALAADLICERLDQRFAQQADINTLLGQIGDMLMPLSPDSLRECQDTILAIVRHQVGAAVALPQIPATVTGTPLTLEWAYGRWLRTRAGLRTPESVDTGRRHFDAFIAHSKLVMLDQVRRSHVVAWRDSLVDSGEYRPNSVNQRLQLVGAILRAGWRDAEMAEQNLKGIILPNPDDNDRGSWERGEILQALNALKPHSWPAWVYLIGLTTGVRIGEPMAARVDWFNPNTGMIEVNDRRFTKAKKLHCMPIIPCLREPLIAYAQGRPGDEFLFADAPRPSNPKLRAGHEASKWYSRFFARQNQKIDRVYHELRDTWIEAAKHSPVERDIWEIISGHSAATVSDRYGGKKPGVLVAANEKICEFLTGDPELKAAMLRLVS